MLNIAETVPPAELIPPNSRNSITADNNRPNRPRSNSTNFGMVEIPSAPNSFEFRELLPIPELLGISVIDGTRSMTSRSLILNDDRVPGIGWNWFRGRN